VFCLTRKFSYQSKIDEFFGVKKVLSFGANLRIEEAEEKSLTIESFRRCKLVWLKVFLIGEFD